MTVGPLAHPFQQRGLKPVEVPISMVGDLSRFT
jgi:hypothetical protein